MNTYIHVEGDDIDILRFHLAVKARVFRIVRRMRRPKLQLFGGSIIAPIKLKEAVKL